MRFTDRLDAGRRLAARLESLRGTDLVVLGLPRGGVPVAREVARALGAPLDVILVRKLGVPVQPELGMGAIGEGGVRIINHEVVDAAGVRPEQIDAVERQERTELERRARRYRGGRRRRSLEGRVALVVDDGIATGSTARAACRVARALGASRVILAAPVAPPSVIPMLARDADQVVVLDTPEEFWAIGQFYDDFGQITDEEVVDLLSGALGSEDEARDAPACPPRQSSVPPPLDAEVRIRASGMLLGGHLTVESARGVVVFAHGAGPAAGPATSRRF
jgi:putative phosphoribosyl transferase